MLSVGVDPAHTDITEAIHASLQHEVTEVLCQACGGNQRKTRWTEIIAAPKILRIHLQILGFEHKIYHTLSYPDNLDLTALQQIPRLPLRYQLSSVVSHYGHYVDTAEANSQASELLAKTLQEDADGEGAREGETDEEIAKRLQAEIYAAAAVEKEEDIKEDDVETAEKHEEEERQENNSEDEDQDENDDEGQTEEPEEEGGNSEGVSCSSREIDECSEHDATDAESAEDVVYESDELCRIMDDTDTPVPSADTRSTKEKATPGPESVMIGHYIASVREPDGTFSTIDDSSVQPSSREKFLSNPLRSEGREFQAYILTYIRDDSERQMEWLRSTRWRKEVTSLREDGPRPRNCEEGVYLRFPRERAVVEESQTGEGAPAHKGKKRKREKHG